MILTGSEIKKRVNNGEIVISNFDEKQLGPNSYNLKLHNELLIYDKIVIDMKKENTTKKITIPEEGLILRPGTLYLGRTVEFTGTKNLVPMLEGRSSIGRVGILVHQTAGFGDIGFGYTEDEHGDITGSPWTLELSCIEMVKIYPWIEICQIYYHEICGDIDKVYNGKYQGNSEIQASMIYKDFNK